MVTGVACRYKVPLLWVVLVRSQHISMDRNLKLISLFIDEFGTAEQKERFLPGMVKGKILGAFGLTERKHLHRHSQYQKLTIIS